MPDIKLSYLTSLPPATTHLNPEKVRGGMRVACGKILVRYQPQSGFRYEGCFKCIQNTLGFVQVLDQNDPFPGAVFKAYAREWYWFDGVSWRGVYKSPTPFGFIAHLHDEVYLDNQQAASVIALAKQGVPIPSLARTFGVSPRHINEVFYRS